MELKKRIRVFRSLICSAVIILAATEAAIAAHPLITDDTGTQGTGKFQLEINGQFGSDNNDGVIQHTTPTGATLTYGIVDNLDLALGLPYQYIKTKDPETSTHSGFSDLALSLKWRFYEKNGLSFALKPSIAFPTGDDEKELGTGKMTYSLFFIATREMKPWAFHLNIGYIGNENKIDQ